MKTKLKQIYKIVITVCFMQIALGSEILPPCEGNGKGRQFVHGCDPDKTVFGEEGDKITELTKNETTYTYSRTAQQTWCLSFDQNQVKESIPLFTGVRHRLTRLVDVRNDHGQLEVLTAHPKGYYYFLLKKEESGWEMKVWANISQLEFLMKGGAVASTVTSVSIAENHEVIIERKISDEKNNVTTYVLNPSEKRIPREGYDSGDAYFLMRN